MSASPFEGVGLPEWIVIGLVAFGVLAVLVVALIAIVAAIGNRGAKDGLPEDADR